MTTLFHAAPIPLEPGSIILPGNWGRILRHFGNRHPSWRRELELESWHALYYPTKPSRFEACFACPDEARIRAFVRSTEVDPNAIPRLMYEVQAVNPEAPSHVGDWNAVAPIGDETFAQCAAHYWAASRWITVVGFQDLQCAEVVLMSAMRIVRRVE